LTEKRQILKSASVVTLVTIIGCICDYFLDQRVTLSRFLSQAGVLSGMALAGDGLVSMAGGTVAARGSHGSCEHPAARRGESVLAAAK
jgi:hypothetical protein